MTLFFFSSQLHVWAALLVVTQAQLTGGDFDADKLKAETNTDLERSKKSKLVMNEPTLHFSQTPSGRLLGWLI